MNNKLCGILVKFACIITLTLSALSAYSQQYRENVFAVAQLNFDSYRAACDLQCILTKKDAKLLISGIASVMGIHPKYVYLALEAVAPTAIVKGIKTFYDLPFPPGYAYCTSRVAIKSLFNGGGDTSVDVKIFRDHAGIYTATPNPGPGQGQSSVEGTVQVIGVRPRLLEKFKRLGICKDTPTEWREILACRGNPCPPKEDDSVATIAKTANVGVGDIGSAEPKLKTPPSADGM
jgi:hypothetical protein